MAKIFIEKDSDGWWVRRQSEITGIYWAVEFCLTKWGATRAAKKYIKQANDPKKPKQIYIGETRATD